MLALTLVQGKPTNHFKEGTEFQRYMAPVQVTQPVLWPGTRLPVSSCATLLPPSPSCIIIDSCRLISFSLALFFQIKVLLLLFQWRSDEGEMASVCA